MSSITLDISTDESIARGVGMLQRLLGNAPAPAKPAAAASAPAPVQPATTAQEKVGQGAGAPAASSSTPAASAEVTFDTLKKAFLSLSNTKGRAACEGVLQPLGLAKLSEAKPEQYAALATAIAKAAA